MVKVRSAIFLSVLMLCAAAMQAGGRRYQPAALLEGESAPSPAPSREKRVETLEQRIMTIGEMIQYFTDLRQGTALRLTYSNGAEYAGNFEGREPGRALIYCRNGLGARRQVPLRKVVDAYIIESSTLTVRIHQRDFPWREE